MNYKKIRSKRIAERERPVNAHYCPKCNGMTIRVPLGPAQSCQLCPKCQWSDFGKD